MDRISEIAACLTVVHLRIPSAGAPDLTGDFCTSRTEKLEIVRPEQIVAMQRQIEEQNLPARQS